MTKQEIIDYIKRNDYVVNIPVLMTMIDALELPNTEIKLPEVNISADKLLFGATALNSNGEIVKGSCLNNAKLPLVPKTIKWITKEELPEGSSAIVQVGNIWTLIKN